MMPQVQLFKRLRKTGALGITGGPWNAVSRGKTIYRRVTLRQEHLMVTFRAMQLLSLTAVVCTRLERMGVLE